MCNLRQFTGATQVILRSNIRFFLVRHTWRFIHSTFQFRSLLRAGGGGPGDGLHGVRAGGGPLPDDDRLLAAGAQRQREDHPLKYVPLALHYRRAAESRLAQLRDPGPRDVAVQVIDWQ